MMVKRIRDETLLAWFMPAISNLQLSFQEDLRKALLASVQDDMTPQTSWVKDPNGRHTNLSAMFDWPEDSDDSDSEAPNPQQQKAAGKVMA